MNSDIAVTNNMIVNQANVGTVQSHSASGLTVSGGQETTATATTQGDIEHNNGQQTKDDSKRVTGTETVGETGEGSQDSQQKQQDEQDTKNESSNLSTAFTISFEDDAPANTKKQFGIRDSIRKFAPPKPHTIEKPRTSKSDNQDTSYMSIESAPGGFPKHALRRDPNNSCRSSGRKSDSSRHSNISESAAFLIDKMLNCKQGESLSSICLNSSERHTQKDKKGARSKGSTPGKKQAHSSDNILDDEIDFCEEKSDNGTYIVGADPESDAARRKIDELFGVVKAAEASLLKTSGMKQATIIKPQATISRPSRQADKKPMLSRERQDHINRLAIAGRHSSRSSSSSRQELASAGHHRQASVTRQSRNSSCDRASKLPSSRHRRAASQSSRHSSNHEPSEGDTQSSRSSLHHDVEIPGHELSHNPAGNPSASMKFNRAFALRRARLGLGEPSPLPRMSSGLSNGAEPESLNMSPRRTLAQRYANHQTSSGGGGQQQNLSRTDGGRFSLRMRNNPVPSRLMSGVLHETTGRSSQQGTLIDSYLNKVSGSKGSRFNQVAPPQQHNYVHSTSAIIPYQSGDELELASPLAYKSLNAKSLGARRENLSELESDIDYATEKFNFSLGPDQSENQFRLSKGSRTCDSASGARGSSGQLGALDCLVISAISSLSVKIRSSVCDLMIEHARRLPAENETRLIVEEILPQLTANSSRPKSPTSIEEIDQSLYFDLAQALKNLKKVEQMVDVMKQVSNQIPESPTSSSSQHNSNSKCSPAHSQGRYSNKRGGGGGPTAPAASTTATGATTEGSESNPNSESTSLSPT